MQQSATLCDKDTHREGNPQSPCSVQNAEVQPWWISSLMHPWVFCPWDHIYCQQVYRHSLDSYKFYIIKIPFLNTVDFFPTLSDQNNPCRLSATQAKENLPKASEQEQHLRKSKCLSLHRVKALISSLKRNAKRSTKINSSIKQQERSKAVGGSSSKNDLNPRGICADAAQLHNTLQDKPRMHQRTGKRTWEKLLSF